MHVITIVDPDLHSGQKLSSIIETHTLDSIGYPCSDDKGLLWRQLIVYHGYSIKRNTVVACY